jgi:HrpA-like RNA helicase
MNSFDSSKISRQSKYQELSIKELESDIIKSIQNNLVTFISSKTGSGKSTQVPQYLYKYLLNKKKKNSFCIICTEPRTIACESIIEYIKLKNKNINILRSITKQELEEKKPKLFLVKENDILFQLKIDPYLKNCDILIIDEVHERTMKLELLLYYIKNFTLSDEKNIKREFKLVLMSATFDIDNIYSYFSSLKNKDITFGFVKQNKLDETQGNNYDIIYSNYNNNSLRFGIAKFNEFNMGKILREISKIVRYEVYLNDYTKKTILIFLPDYKTIYSLYNMLDKEYKGYIYLYQFSGALNIKQQKDIFKELWDNKRKEDIICNVIIATNLAETCLTFPNCDIVIDSGLKKNCKYNYECNLYEEVIEYISQDSCIQRSGRCGRGKNKGIVYRVFSEEIFNKMDKYRKSEIEISNIDLIILKLFETKAIEQHVKNELKQKGYLDFLSKIEKVKFNKIVDKLRKYKAIEKKDFSSNEIITEFGKWIKQTNLDIELGFYFDKFREKYKEELKKEEVFQMLNIISTTDNYNSELFYTDIDPDKFKLCLIDNQKESSNNKTLTDLAENISKDIIQNALYKYKNNYPKIYNSNGIIEESKNNSDDLIKYNIDFINNLYHNSPYYYLYSKLDEIYNGKNFFTKNKIFQLGDWTITLFFTIQYNLMSCLKHNYFPKKDNELCEKCELSKYFYCYVYSLNDKYFITKKNRGKHIKKALEIENKNEIFYVCENEEKILSKWNLIY